MSKDITFGRKALEKLYKGIEKLERAVGITLGPSGRTVLLETQYKDPHPTKDGVTVSKEVSLEDPVENLGVRIIREASEVTNSKVGDGTTTSIVLAKAFVEEGLKLLSMNISPTEIKRKYQELSSKALQYLKNISVKPNKKLLRNIIEISSNSDNQVYELVDKAFELATLDGVITVEESKVSYSYVEKVNGYSFERGIVSPTLFPDRADLSVEIENPLIILYDDKVRNSEEILPLLKRLSTEHPGRPVVFIADEFNPQAIHILSVNNHSRGFQFYAVQSPSYGENRDWMLEDIAILTGGVVISKNYGTLMKEATPEYAGSADKVVIGLHETSIIGGHGDPDEIKERILYIKDQIRPETTSYEKDFLKGRVARLTGGAAKIKIFAPTEGELKEMKDRVDDALHAYRAAATSGILPGGGIALFRFSTDFDDEVGPIEHSFLTAIKAPFKRILDNAGESHAAISDKLENTDTHTGYNVASGTIENLIDTGVVDSLSVVSQALTNAVSAALTILSSDAVITVKPDTEVDLSTPPTMDL